MTNILGNASPEKPLARWSPADGRAVIEMPDGRVFSYQQNGKRGKIREEQRGFHSGMFLQPAIAAQLGKPIQVTDDIGEYPFLRLQERIRFELDVHDALRFFLVSMDRDHSEGLRQKAMRRAIRLLEIDEVRARVEPSLLAKPLPEGFDSSLGPKEGHAGRILREIAAL